MKNIISLVIVTILMVSSLSAQEKTKKNTKREFSVAGVCDMCEKRIESAALIKGVKMVEWDKTTQTILVVYNNKKTSEQQIHQAIVDAGHDTSLMKASEDSYAKLPGCCAYRDGIKSH